MSRLTQATYDTLDQSQRELWDHIVATRGTALGLVTEEGTLAGPFGAFVSRPELGRHLIEVGGAVRFGGSLPERLKELAITTVGARWRSEFEFWAHSRLAIEAGIDQSIIDALAAGDDPPFDDPAERAVYDVAVALAGNGRIPDDVFAAAQDAVGADGMVDLVHAIGYYSHISFILNAFEIPLPPGVDQTWPDHG